MTVQSVHPEYSKNLNNWKLVNDIIRNDAKKHLIAPDDNPSRTYLYRELAVLYNFTKLTRDGLTGLVFRKPEEVNYPSQLDYLEKDATGAGLNLHQLGKFLCFEVLRTGRVGLLVDYPQTSKNLSKKDSDRLQYKARVKTYIAESVINWDTVTIGSKTMLSLIVLKETKKVRDIFCWSEQVQYRVLKLESVDGSNVYTQEIWNDKNERVGRYSPENANGDNFDYIPFFFIGSENNDWAVDTSPLLDIAILNLSNYRSSADFFENAHFLGQSTAIIGGDIDINEFKEHYGESFKVGARGAYYIPGATAIPLEFKPNTLALEAMRVTHEQAVSLGAKIVSPPTGRQTAEGERQRYGSQNSSLRTITDNISSAVTDAINEMAVFMIEGYDITSREVQYTLNEVFYEDSADPNLLTSMMMGLDPSNNVYTAQEIRDYSKKAGVLNPNAPDKLPEVKTTTGEETNNDFINVATPQAPTEQ